MEFKLSVNEALYTIDHVTTNLVQGRLNNHVPVHRHPVFHILYFLEGKGSVTVGSATKPVEPGMLCVISPDEPHGFLFGDGVPLTNLECTFRLVDGGGQAAVCGFHDIAAESSPAGAEAPPSSEGSQPFRVPSRFRLLLSEGFDRILELYDSPLPPRHYGFLVADLMARVQLTMRSLAEAAADPNAEMIAGVKQFLTANRGRPVTLQEVADAAHITPNYLCRVFRAHTGTTPMGYLQKVRMREADKLLSLTDLPVYTIAERLGYEDPSYFSRVFRSLHGVSPHDYRKNACTRL